MIGFIGLIAPHLVRLVLGPSYQRLLLLSPIVGAALLLVADIVARTIVTPAELPVGIVTALIGTPFFVWMQLRSRRAGVT
jgi:iron complex transport system permease protein